MQEAILVGKQVLLIFIYILIGILCVKKKVVAIESGRALSNFLLTVVTPCLMIKSYIREVEEAHLRGLTLAFLLAVMFHGIAITASSVLIKKREDLRYRIERMAAIYSNCGFMAIPLIAVSVGDIGLFYAVAFISIFNIMIWSQGVMLMTGQKKFNIKSAVFNPGVIGFAIGFIVYCTQIHVPVIINQAITSISDLNTPLAMITTGIFLSNIDFRSTLNNVNIYFAGSMRLVILPIIMLLMVKVLGVSHWMPGANDVIMTSILAAACPTAASVTLFPAKFGLDGEYGAKIIAVSTLFSVVTLPVFTLIIKMWL
ncbi:MAG: putative rane protein [Clostridia bacterium]|jgi:predicted permease|nr:putative rane protein [Clostridia bacterium]